MIDETRTSSYKTVQKQVNTFFFFMWNSKLLYSINTENQKMFRDYRLSKERLCRNCVTGRRVGKDNCRVETLIKEKKEIQYMCLKSV